MPLTIPSVSRPQFTVTGPAKKVGQVVEDLLHRLGSCMLVIEQLHYLNSRIDNATPRLVS